MPKHKQREQPTPKNWTISACLTSLALLLSMASCGPAQNEFSSDTEAALINSTTIDRHLATLASDAFSSAKEKR